MYTRASRACGNLPHQDIEFTTTDGLKLREWMYSAGEKRPTILMSHGFSGAITYFLDDYAQRFQAAGYTVLAYDNRNWYTSDGTPRNESDPVLQSRDYTTAFNYASSLPDVDETNIVFWGSSLSGGNVIYAGAIDKRVRAIICQVPFVSGELVSATLGPKAGFVLADRAQVFKGHPSQMIPVVPDSIEEVQSGNLPNHPRCSGCVSIPGEARAARRQMGEYTTAQSLFYLQSFDPRAFIHRIAPTPLLMVVGGKDTCIPMDAQVAMYELAGGPKRLHIIPDAGHFDVYHGKAFEENIQVQLEFLKGLF